MTTLVTDMTDPHLMSVGEYARRIGVSEATVRRWARRGLVPATKVGPRLWRLDPDAPLRTLPSRRARRLTTNYVAGP